MYRIFLLLICGILCLVTACSNSVGYTETVNNGITVDTLSGMLRIPVYDARVVLGTTNELAKSNERPQMVVILDYPFSIGKSEVTCGEFKSLMKSQDYSIDCDNNDLPIMNVSYYDAVLFANERSKKEGLDTAYTYSGLVYDSDKHCSNLEGFAFHPEVNAYRLPTEAEWVLVASINWNPAQAWTAENSDYKVHRVCGKNTAENETCDMAGNVMEWVNDWLGNFRDTTVTNYVGAPDGGSLGQRILKGGSNRNPAYSITLFSRGDVYTVTSSTRANYVGFRLAYGAIPNALWMGSDGKAAVSRVVPLANSSTLRSFTKTYAMKLAFRNDLTGNLAYIDYLGGALTVEEIQDSLNVYHPDISPDGKKVAFSTGLEGIAGKSAIYVRDLDVKGSNLVKLDVESAAIPRWRVLGNGDTAIVYVTDAGNNKNESDFKAASTWLVTFANGKFGEPQKLFDGAYHGGISEDNSLAVTGARLLRARVGESSVVWYNEEQACNASLAQDSSKRTLFLDFGGKTGRDFVGSKYGTHERILVADSTGKLIQSVGAPEGYSFDHSEWIPSGNNLVVATLTNANGAHTKIVLVDMSDGSVVELAEGDELWHPAFWFRKRVATGDGMTLDLDSAGMYLAEDHINSQSKHRVKMELYWKNLNTTNVLLVGSSRMEMGIDADMFPEWNMFNWAIPGIDPVRDMYFAANYGLNHSEHLKAVAFSLDIDSWRGTEDFLSMMLYSSPGYMYDANHQFWKDGVPEDLIAAVENSYPAETDVKHQISDRGTSMAISRGWAADPIEVFYDSVYTAEQMNFFNGRIEELKFFVEMASAKGIYVIGIIFPQAPQYKKTGALGLYGLQRSVAKEVIESLQAYSKENKYFILMDENKMGDHDYTDAMAHNRDHLSYLGAAQITARLDSVLKTLKW